MLSGILCAIKIGKLCRCFCLSRGINACILIFSAAGSCWMPSGWFSHPPGTPVTASAHTEICKTFFSWCQCHHSGKVKPFIELPVLLNVTLFPLQIPAHSQTNGTSGSLRCNILTWAHPAVRLSEAMTVWSALFLIFSLFTVASKGQKEWYILWAYLACHSAYSWICVCKATALPYSLISTFKKYLVSTDFNFLSGKTEICREDALTIHLIV